MAAVKDRVARAAVLPTALPSAVAGPVAGAAWAAVAVMSAPVVAAAPAADVVCRNRRRDMCGMDI